MKNSLKYFGSILFVVAFLSGCTTPTEPTSTEKPAEKTIAEGKDVADKSAEETEDTVVTEEELIAKGEAFIRQYYQNIADGNFEEAYAVSTQEVSFEMFRNWYTRTDKIDVESITSTDSENYQIAVTLYEGPIVTAYSVQMTLEYAEGEVVKIADSQVQTLWVDGKEGAEYTETATAVVGDCEREFSGEEALTSSCEQKCGENSVLFSEEIFSPTVTFFSGKQQVAEMQGAVYEGYRIPKCDGNKIMIDFGGGDAGAFMGGKIYFDGEEVVKKTCGTMGGYYVAEDNEFSLAECEQILGQKLENMPETE